MQCLDIAMLSTTYTVAGYVTHCIFVTCGKICNGPNLDEDHRSADVVQQLGDALQESSAVEMTIY